MVLVLKLVGVCVLTEDWGAREVREVIGCVGKRG